MQLYLNFDRALAATEVEAFREMIRRRGRREPLQHILGSTSFCGLEIKVSRHALIPRPETELLAEHGWTFLQQASALNPQPSTALDFGTGTGCLAIALATKCPATLLQAIDISPGALELARQNAAHHSLSDRIEFRQGDGFAALPPGARFDLIISNPPYIPGPELENLQREVRDFDPRPALDGGPDGLDHMRRLAAEAATFLRPRGKLMLEFGDGQAELVARIFDQEKWIVEATHLDYNQKPRILVARRADSSMNE